MPPEQKRELFTLILMVGLIGLVLIITTILLMSVWRRHLRRQKAELERESSAESPDIWQASGQRLLAGTGGESRSVHDDDNEDEDDRDDEYDDGYPREDPF